MRGRGNPDRAFYFLLVSGAPEGLRLSRGPPLDHHEKQRPEPPDSCNLQSNHERIFSFLIRGKYGPKTRIWGGAACVTRTKSSHNSRSHRYPISTGSADGSCVSGIEGGSTPSRSVPRSRETSPWTISSPTSRCLADIRRGTSTRTMLITTKVAIASYTTITPSAAAWTTNCFGLP